jgi:hypothetical protein
MSKKLEIKIGSNEKEWYKSLTIQSALGVLLVVVGNALQTKMFGLEEILVVVGCITTIYGRIKAKKNLK